MVTLSSTLSYDQALCCIKNIEVNGNLGKGD